MELATAIRDFGLTASERQRQLDFEGKAALVLIFLAVVMLLHRAGRNRYATTYIP